MLLDYTITITIILKVKGVISFFRISCHVKVLNDNDSLIVFLMQSLLFIYLFIYFSCFYHLLNIGRIIVNVAPLPSVLFSAYNFPPCASTIFLETYRPNPVPL